MRDSELSSQVLGVGGLEAGVSGMGKTNKLSSFFKDAQHVVRPHPRVGGASLRECVFSPGVVRELCKAP